MEVKKYYIKNSRKSKDKTLVMNATRESLVNAKSKRPTLFERQLLLHEHRCNESGSVIQRYLPYYQYGFPELLREQRREILWGAVEKIVKRVERRHFQRCYQKDTYATNHQDRIIAFYELAQARWDKSPAWIITAFTQGFAEIEALLQLRRLGVSLSEYDEEYNDEVTFPILQYRRWFCKVFVQYFIIQRRKESEPQFNYAMLYYEQRGVWPSKTTIDLFNSRSEKLVQMINMSSENVFGFGNSRSLDDANSVLYEYEFYSNNEGDGDNAW